MKKAECMTTGNREERLKEIKQALLDQIDTGMKFNFLTVHFISPIDVCLVPLSWAKLLLHHKVLSSVFFCSQVFRVVGGTVNLWVWRHFLVVVRKICTILIPLPKTERKYFVSIVIAGMNSTMASRPFICITLFYFYIWTSRIGFCFQLRHWLFPVFTRLTIARIRVLSIACFVIICQSHGYPYNSYFELKVSALVCS